MKKALITKIDEIVKPIGFILRSSTWNRRVNEYVDVINLQKTSIGFIINIGVYLNDVFKYCWPTLVLDFVEDPHCIVVTRVNHLLINTPYKGLWNKENSDSIQEIPIVIENYILPYFNNAHSINGIEMILEDTLKPKKPFGGINTYAKLYLAIIKAKQGKINEAIKLLDQFDSGISKEWSIKIFEIKNLILEGKLTN